MTHFKKITYLFLFLLTLNFAFGANIYNQNGDFKVETNTLKSTVLSNNIETEFSFSITNNLQETQDFKLQIPNQGGWDIVTNEDDFTLNAKETKQINLKFKANSAFDYTPDVVSPDVIKISQNTEYSGFFEFPVDIIGKQTVSLKYDIKIEPVSENIKFTTKIQQTPISPENDLKFTVSSDTIIKNQNVEIIVEANNQKLQTINDVFSKEIPYKIYQIKIPSHLEPNQYNIKVTTRILKDGGESAQEWYSNAKLNLVEYKNIKIEEKTGKGIFRDRVELTLTNLGNVKDSYSREFEFGFFKNLLFGTDSENYEQTETGAKIIIPLNKGETKTITYSFNYLALMIVVLVIITLSTYFYIRKNSNPLAVQTQLYEVQRIKHEGVKSVKVRIGFENIKEKELDKLKIVFRMPTYLQVEENSFSLTEPKHVLKGETQYKLIWDFKRFEKGDTRLLGFTLVNKKGILGDVRIPDLEMKIKTSGKSTKYYKSFPIIKG